MAVGCRVALCGVATAAVVLTILVATTGAADVGKRQGTASGIKGVVLTDAVAGDGVTVTAVRVSTGAVAASAQPAEGRFRLRVKPGLYELTAITPLPPACAPEAVCPALVTLACEAAETKRVRVKRHRWTRVKLRNACLA